MTEEEIKALKKDVSKKKRIASEWASQLHDLVEDRLPAAFDELPNIAEQTYNACQEWAIANDALQAAEKS